jgi:hypothetical protein
VAVVVHRDPGYRAHASSGHCRRCHGDQNGPLDLGHLLTSLRSLIVIIHKWLRTRNHTRAGIRQEKDDRKRASDHEWAERNMPPATAAARRKQAGATTWEYARE